jgi:hypothetical protein
MILYHFTSFYALQNAGPDAILAAGLKPPLIPREDANEVQPSGCVWFTTEADPVPWWKGEDNKPECRIAGVVP